MGIDLLPSGAQGQNNGDRAVELAAAHFLRGLQVLAGVSEESELSPEIRAIADQFLNGVESPLEALAELGVLQNPRELLEDAGFEAELNAIETSAAAERATKEGEEAKAFYTESLTDIEHRESEAARIAAQAQTDLEEATRRLAEATRLEEQIRLEREQGHGPAPDANNIQITVTDQTYRKWRDDLRIAATAGKESAGRSRRLAGEILDAFRAQRQAGAGED